MAKGGVTVDTAAFQSGLRVALADMRDRDGAAYLAELGAQAGAVARGRAPRGETGAVVGGLGMVKGRDSDGPYVDIGTISPPANRHDFYQEFGTFKMAAHPFMRPALAAIAGGVRALGGAAVRANYVGSRGIALRAGKRAVVQRFRRRGAITSAEARQVSRQISNRFRLRARRRF